jgi:hypothetical protein
MSDMPFESIRPLLVSVDGAEVVRVALEYRSELFVGESPADEDGAAVRAAAAARATTSALGQLTPTAVTFAVEWSAVVATEPELPALAVVMVGVDVAGATMRYAGAVAVTDDAAAAAAKAVLDALNRRLGVAGL